MTNEFGNFGNNFKEWLKLPTIPNIKDSNGVFYLLKRNNEIFKISKGFGSHSSSFIIEARVNINENGNFINAIGERIFPQPFEEVKPLPNDEYYTHRDQLPSFINCFPIKDVL